jgi:hypothetical protein
MDRGHFAAPADQSCWAGAAVSFLASGSESGLVAVAVGPLNEGQRDNVDIIYRYQARDTPAKPLPSDSDAALLRLDDGNKVLAALLDHVKDESDPIRQVIEVDPHDFGLAAGKTGIRKQRPFAAIVNQP